MPTFFFSRPFKIYTNFWPENKSSGNPCTKHERAMAALLKYQMDRRESHVAAGPSGRLGL
jgi:hypothetical protein